jgi:hypothetical protein
MKTLSLLPDDHILGLGPLAEELERYLIGEYLVTPHSTTGEAPQARWEAGGFLPHIPESLEQLDLPLLTVAKIRRVCSWARRIFRYSSQIALTSTRRHLGTTTSKGATRTSIVATAQVPL